MQADIEALVLSGDLFNPNRDSSTSPPRSPSPDAGWHDEYTRDRGSDSSDGGSSSSSSAARRRSRREGASANGPRHESIGMKPGRTGVKGVLRDRAEATELDRAQRAREMEEVRRRMERMAGGAMTVLEEEEEAAAAAAVGRGEGRAGSRRDVFGQEREGKFGHLREVGVSGFVAAVEQEDHGVWVVVHIYEPTLGRCCTLDETLARLARVHHGTKFLRARASVLGFAATSTARQPPRLRAPSHAFPGHFPSDEDDDEEEGSDGDYEDRDDAGVDTDVLPTMLVYRDGNLVHNWVRVDWEAGPAGVEELLSKNHIIRSALDGENLSGSSDGGGGDDDDDDDELCWSD